MATIFGIAVVFVRKWVENRATHAVLGEELYNVYHSILINFGSVNGLKQFKLPTNSVCTIFIGSHLHFFLL